MDVRIAAFAYAGQMGNRGWADARWMENFCSTREGDF